MDILKFHHYLAAIIRSARAQANLTQAQVANRAGVTRRYIQSLENGKQETSLSTLFSLAEAMQISPAKIIFDLESAIRDDKLPKDVLEGLPPQKIGRPPKKIENN